MVVNSIIIYWHRVTCNAKYHPLPPSFRSTFGLEIITIHTLKKTFWHEEEHTIKRILENKKELLQGNMLDVR